MISILTAIRTAFDRYTRDAEQNGEAAAIAGPAATAFAA